ncbi:BglG family transcription antiterminator [Orbus mooreae]|uniref:BglG family transcription antiterminator n=1 Tax=Orbus mooreae TaxID=3074107 RepID=UPI00370D8D7B
MNRKIELLKLLFNEATFQPANYFSKKLSVSSKTVYADIEELNDLLTTSPSTDLHIEKSPRKGMMLVGKKNQLEQIIVHLNQTNSHSYFNVKARRFNPHFRRLDIVKRCLLNQENVSLEQLSIDYIVSKTSLHKDFEFINNTIAKEQVALHITHKGIGVTGQEIHIQYAIKHFLSFYIQQQDNDYLQLLMRSMTDDDSFNYINQLLVNHNGMLIQQCSEYYLSSLLIAITIQIKRLSLGYHVEKEDDFLFNHIRYMQSYLIASQLAEKLETDFSVVFTTSDTEYLSKLFFAHRMIDETSKINDQFYARIIKQIINKIGEIERVDLSQDAKLYHSLLSHFPAMITRLQKKIQVINPILEEIKVEYSKLFSILWYALSDLERRFDITLNDHEVSFLLIHFQIALDKAADANNIVIICQYGISSSNLILNKVRQLLPAKDNIEVYSLSKLQSSQLDNVDLIITTLDIGQINKPVVKISSLLNTADYQNIIQTYANYVLNKHGDGVDKIGNWPSITTFLRPNLVHLNVDITSKAQCLDMLLSELEGENYVNANYRESVLNREAIGNTSIEHGIALPHGSPMFVTKSSISLITLNKPIKWGTIDVSIIIMVSLAEKDIININDVFTGIYQIVSDKNLVLQLQSMQSFQQLEQFLSHKKGI